MIRSMTGYGRARAVVEGVGFEVEVRSVNHRYLDLRMRLPRGVSGLEPEVRARVQRRFGRGKVDVTVQQAAGGAAQRLELDLELAGRYVEAAEALRARHGVEGALAARELLGLPGVARLVEGELEPEALGRALGEALDAALERVAVMRAAEGAALERELRGRLARVDALAVELADRAAEVQDQVRERLRKRAEGLARETGSLDEARLHQEVVIAADRLDVTEEIVRLRSHVEQFRAFLDAADDAAETVGRRLDFLLQEMGREANTVGAKSADAPVAHRVVELKTEIERLREQVQNVE